MMTTELPNPLQAFHWTPQPQAEQLAIELVDEFLSRCPYAAALARHMHDATGTRFFDWIDYLVCNASPDLIARLIDAAFVNKPAIGASHRYVHEGGMFPTIILQTGPVRAAIKTESVADFLAANQTAPVEPIKGSPLAPLRMACVSRSHEAELWIVERHGDRGYEAPDCSADHALHVLRHLEAFRLRPRQFANESEGFAAAGKLIDRAIADLGVDRACDVFFAAEREYWQRRNHAAQVQKARQDKLGLGWANHDHHTYRSSRRHFASLIAILEKLGFHCRERFYAGREAGWGAQVLEQPKAGIVIFADVDLSPDELYNDFAHEPLPERKQLGTVGLWCALHGEAFLEAGMHHLECQFDFEALRQQLEAHEGVRTMKPFTDFPYLRQAFTEGERWPVREERLAALLAAGQIEPAQAAQFRQHGAIGSHLENLERNQGFKGFNQQGVSEIISDTDPRKHLA
jgi:hypothetical protein